MIRERGEVDGVAVKVVASIDVVADFGILGRPCEIVADIKIKVAVAVEVGERGGGGPVAIAVEAETLGDILERAVAAVAEEKIRPPSGDEEVGVAVAVDVANARAVGVAFGQGRDPRLLGDVLEVAVMLVAEEPVAGLGGTAREGTALQRINVEPTVAVVIDQGDSAAHRFRELPGLAAAGVEHVGKAGVWSDVVEGDDALAGVGGIALEAEQRIVVHRSNLTAEIRVERRLEVGKVVEFAPKF